MKKIGVLWKHKSKEGKNYLIGSVEILAGIKTPICVFLNEQKKSVKSPDYTIILSEKQKDNKIENIKIENKDNF